MPSKQTPARLGEKGFRETKGRDDWPAGEYLRKCRGKMSIREAARRADVHESWWRAAETGQQQVGALWRDVSIRPETLAAMARAVNANTAELLRLAGHDPGQYEWLLDYTSGDDTNAGVLDRERFSRLSREEREEVIAELQRLHLETELKRTRRGRSA